MNDESSDTGTPAGDVIRIEGREAFADAALSVVAAARRRLCIASQRLDRQVYGHPAFTDALRNLVLSHRQFEVRVLVRDGAAAVRESPGTIELARRLSDRITLHQPRSSDAGQFDEEWLIADETAFLERRSPDHLYSFFGENTPLRAREALRAFEKIWDNSEPSTEMRALGI